jgi:hypothetical protein
MILHCLQRSEAMKRTFRKASQLIVREVTEQKMRNDYENKEILHLFERIQAMEKTFSKVGQLIVLEVTEQKNKK